MWSVFSIINKGGMAIQVLYNFSSYNYICIDLCAYLFEQLHLKYHMKKHVEKFDF